MLIDWSDPDVWADPPYGTVFCGICAIQWKQVYGSGSGAQQPPPGLRLRTAVTRGIAEEKPWLGVLDLCWEHLSLPVLQQEGVS